MEKPTMKKIVKQMIEKMEDASEQWYDGQITNAELDQLVTLAYDEYRTLYDRNIKGE